MAETEILLKGQDDWQAFVNAMKKKMDALPSGEVEYIQNFASLSNGASADGNGLYRFALVWTKAPTLTLMITKGQLPRQKTLIKALAAWSESSSGSQLMNRKE